MTKRNKINKKDLNRVLLTETLPYETPITFSPDYLYSKLRKIPKNSIYNRLIKGIVLDARKATIPYRYQIRKTEDSQRRLALLHPNSQWKIKEFYEKYSGLILYFTSKSDATIRSPNRIAGSFYAKQSWENVYKYKDDEVSTEDFGDYARHAPSYFTYRGYDRLWKFYNSDEYIELERKFSYLVTIDVSKCFDSIYTHCLGWATKNKNFVKENLRNDTFGDEFDKVIRHGNHDETNGIPIGPESSRIFAEIILQRIDCDAINKLTPDYIFNKHFSIRRYVDDVHIYADSESTANAVKVAYTECLLAFNLHTNPLKFQLQTRPFVTKKSTLVSLSLIETERLSEKIFRNQGNKLGISVAHRPEVLFRNYVTSIKTICQQVGSTYYDISSLLIAVFVERIKKICEGSADAEVSDDERFNCLKLVLDVCFFLYGVAPSVSSSYKLSSAIILLIRYFRQNNYKTAEQMCNYIYHSVGRLLIENTKPRNHLINEFVDLEAINIVLASRELGYSFNLSPEMVRTAFFGESKKSYFSLTACLFYIGNNSYYDDIRNEIVSEIDKNLGDCKNIKLSSEKAHIFLDSISCPYIASNIRAKWINIYLATNGGAAPWPQVINFVDEMDEDWTASWLTVDLLNSLEKRELKRAY